MKNIDRFADLETGYSGMLYPMEIDHMEHANVRYYSRAFNETAYFMFTFAGITPEYMRDNDCGMAAVEEHHYYRREIQAGRSCRGEDLLYRLHRKMAACLERDDQPHYRRRLRHQRPALCPFRHQRAQLDAVSDGYMRAREIARAGTAGGLTAFTRPPVVSGPYWPV